MLAPLRHWLARRRFEKLFVRPTEAALKAARARHDAGVRKVLEQRRHAVHAALRGQG